jgi:hypothetical protein
MEVRANVPAQSQFEWRGILADGKPDVGLFYGSTKGLVAARKLTLTLYKLYKEQVKDPFVAKLAVTFELGQGAGAAVMPTDPAKTGANLICSQTKNYPGKFAKTGDLSATLTFELSVAELKSQACESVVIIDLEKKVDTFKGSLTGVEFAAPELNKTYEFPAVGGTPYVLKPVVVAGGDVNVSTTAGDCLNGFNVDTKVCLDRVSVALPDSKNYVIAKVKGKSKTGTEVTYFVGAGENAFGLLDSQSLSVAAINKALSPSANDAEKKTFSFWSAAIEPTIFDFPFDKDFADGKQHQTFVVARDSLVDVVKFLHIDTVWYHGFREVSATTLNTRAAARWLVLVKAKKDGEQDQEFFVGGYDKYFSSSKAPAGSTDAPKYFEMSTLVQEMALSSGTTKWRLYAIKGAAMADSACALDKTSYLNELSQRTNEAVKPGSSEEAKLDACEIVRERFNGALGSYTIEPVYYEWAWHRL